jgi:hypothetical protein
MSRENASIVAAVLLACALAGCGSGAPPPGASSPAVFCDTFRPVRAKVNAARDQINATPSSQTLQESFNTIATQVKIGLDASPPTEVKGDIQTFYDAVVATQSQLAAIGYDITKLATPLTLQDPQAQQAGEAIEKWANVHCGTPLSTQPSG